MASKQELRALIVLAGKIDPSLQSAMLKASGESLKLSNRLKQSAKGMNSLSTIAKGTFVGSLAANAVSSMTGKIWEMSSQSLKLASDLTEVQNVVDTTFGKSAAQINAWSKTAKNAYGLSELQAKQFTGTMGAMLKSSGVTGESMIKMSQNLTGLSGDFASFYNLNQEEAFEKIRSGISGETEPLKQLGINMSVANLEAFALSQGIKTSYQKMDQASQTMLRYNYLLSTSADAQGDFAKTQGSYANQQRLFKTNMQELGATIATKALPYLTQWMQSANSWAQRADVAGLTESVSWAFDTLGDTIQWARDNSNWLIPVVAGVAGSMTALQIIGTVSGLYRAWTATTFAQTLAQQGLNAALRANPIGLIVTGIGILIGAGVALWRNWDTIKSKAADLWAAVKKFLGPIASIFGSGGGSNFQAMSAGAMPAFASGGIATGPSVFGEAGPEIAIPLQRTPRSLGLLQQTARILGAGGNSANITIYVTAPGGDAKQIASATKDAVLGIVEEYFGDKVRVSYA